jgi:hypothetical protein
MHGTMNMKFNALCFELALEEAVDLRSRRFGTTYRSHLHGSINYHCTLRNSMEERRSDLLRGGILKSHRL